MTVKHRIEQLEQQHRHHDETFELMGMILTGSELRHLIESGFFKGSTQDGIDETDNAP